MRRIVRWTGLSWGKWSATRTGYKKKPDPRLNTILMTNSLTSAHCIAPNALHEHYPSTCIFLSHLEIFNAYQSISRTKKNTEYTNENMFIYFKSTALASLHFLKTLFNSLILSLILSPTLLRGKTLRTALSCCPVPFTDFSSSQSAYSTNFLRPTGIFHA